MCKLLNKLGYELVGSCSYDEGMLIPPILLGVVVAIMQYSSVQEFCYHMNTFPCRNRLDVQTGIPTQSCAGGRELVSTHNNESIVTDYTRTCTHTHTVDPDRNTCTIKAVADHHFFREVGESQESTVRTCCSTCSLSAGIAHYSGLAEEW